MENILEIKNLKVNFIAGSKTIHAVRGVDLELKKGETLAIVGESGSGKSVTVRACMGLLSSNARIASGEILFNGKDITKMSNRQIEKYRGRSMSMILQDPMTSLNPLMKIGKQISEPLIAFHNMDKKSAKEKSIELLRDVGIISPEKRIDDYPHMLSGGQRQRINIAIALACHPKILIADEPTTALDVTIQAQILDIFKRIQQESDTSIIFITHDLGVVANIADRVAVMYGGKVVEYGSVNEVFYNPQHPYTWGLICSMPTLQTKSRLKEIEGSIPSMINPPQGDLFAYRSDYSMEIDFVEEPPFFEVAPGHYAATWLLHPNAPKYTVPEEIKRRYEIYKSSGL